MRPRHLAAREGVEAAVEVGIGEAEAAGYGCSSLAPTAAARVLESFLRARIGRQRLGIVGARGHRILEAPKVCLHGERLVRASDDVRLERQVAVERRSLIVEGHPRSLRERELAAVHGDLARQHTKERRLPGAVRAEQCEAIAAADRERDVGEQGFAGELLTEVGCSYDRHGAFV